MPEKEVIIMAGNSYLKMMVFFGSVMAVFGPVIHSMRWLYQHQYLVHSKFPDDFSPIAFYDGDLAFAVILGLVIIVLGIFVGKMHISLQAHKVAVYFGFPRFRIRWRSMHYGDIAHWTFRAEMTHSGAAGMFGETGIGENFILVPKQLGRLPEVYFNKLGRKYTKHIIYIRYIPFNLIRETEKLKILTDFLATKGIYREEPSKYSDKGEEGNNQSQEAARTQKKDKANPWINPDNPNKKKTFSLKIQHPAFPGESTPR